MSVHIVPVMDLIRELLAELSRGQLCVLRVRGNSMSPFLYDNRDLVTLKKALPSELKRGSIILFEYNTQYLLHRIIKRKGANYYLRGDNNWSFRMENCRIGDVLGVAVKVERDGREISCSSRSWRLLSFIWMKTHFIRVVLLKTYYFSKQITRKIRQE